MPRLRGLAVACCLRRQLGRWPQPARARSARPPSFGGSSPRDCSSVARCSPCWLACEVARGPSDPDPTPAHPMGGRCTGPSGRATPWSGPAATAASAMSRQKEGCTTLAGSAAPAAWSVPQQPGPCVAPVRPAAPRVPSVPVHYRWPAPEPHSPSPQQEAPQDALPQKDASTSSRQFRGRHSTVAPSWHRQKQSTPLAEEAAVRWVPSGRWPS